MLSLFLTGCVLTNEKVVTEQALLKQQLDDHIQEWQAVKPIIERLTQSEKDLNFLIAELEKQSSLENEPSDKQLNQDALFTAPPPAKKKEVVYAHSSTIFAIHLASYKKQNSLIKGWHIYQKKYPTFLKDKKAMMQIIDISGTQYRRLIAAPYTNAEVALKACNKVKQQQDFCTVVSYDR